MSGETNEAVAGEEGMALPLRLYAAVKVTYGHSQDIVDSRGQRIATTWVHSWDYEPQDALANATIFVTAANERPAKDAEITGLRAALERIHETADGALTLPDDDAVDFKSILKIARDALAADGSEVRND